MKAISIDHIVLDGIELAPEQQDLFRARLAGELERRLAAGPAPRSAGELSSRPVELVGDPAELAARVALRVEEALKG